MPGPSAPVIVWFRNDLRLADNPALQCAASSAHPVLPIFILETGTTQPACDWSVGAASQWWLYRSLQSLSKDLQTFGLKLRLFTGGAEQIIESLVEQTGASMVVWNRRYEPQHIAIDKSVKATLKAADIEVTSFPGNVLHEPWSVTRAAEQPYRVFTAWWKASQKIPPAGSTSLVDAPRPFKKPVKNEVKLNELGLAAKESWAEAFNDYWLPGETGARAQLNTALGGGADHSPSSSVCAIAPGKSAALHRYADSRDFPAIAGTSRLSPHLVFGELSPRQIQLAIRQSPHWKKQPQREQLESYLRQLGWRDFATHLLYYFPHTPEQPLDTRFEKFPWVKKHSTALRRWQQGNTGIPLVDAGMRELWHSGWMHNRLRMVVGSFLIKNLGLHWLHGARWFWDTLLDADLANNTMGWQWVAGCGADAAPYFRVFNPLRQAERFDKQAEYVRYWVPELSALPDKFIHAPWTAPDDILQAANVTLGNSYPKPIVDLSASRVEALARFEQIKKA